MTAIQKTICKLQSEQKVELSWDGDNSYFVVQILLPNLDLSDDDKHHLAMAYGYNGEKKSYEPDSDGETIVKDFFLNGKIKAPQGVAHDYINRVPNHTTPDGKVWTRQQSNNFYYRISRAIGYPFAVRFRRWLALTLTSYWWR